ncbi:hypothetical protein L195_g022462 [Trifolium pratense]|uniref:Uncharacterized protein n=1 Tax=Trifolium pratense TaxID=57577 RepID=A0A2K3N833_TRIPR|nr:hypothetical protein L195_g022462 [Trifolium pratense]
MRDNNITKANFRWRTFRGSHNMAKKFIDLKEMSKLHAPSVQLVELISICRDEATDKDKIMVYRSDSGKSPYLQGRPKVHIYINILPFLMLDLRHHNASKQRLFGKN